MKKEEGLDIKNSLHTIGIVLDVVNSTMNNIQIEMQELKEKLTKLEEFKNRIEAEE